METVGLYLHVPFCRSKCPYCDFYSLPLGSDLQGEALLDAYVAALLRAMDEWSDRGDYRVDTLYFGGGTPSLLGGRRLAILMDAADRRFGLFRSETPEVTLEANPADDLSELLRAFVEAGGNRLSLGMQSAAEAELAFLGRRHRPADVERSVADARKAGIRRLSLDLMLGLSRQTREDVEKSARRVAALGAEHVSAYLLKIEPDTAFGKHPPALPDEEETAELYLTAMEELENLGYRQYEISNLSKPGEQSRHNLKYWNGDPYLGLGPAAASCLGGRRFTYPRDLTAFISGNEPIPEEESGIPTGSEEEYAMLRLRLTEGIREAGFSSRFGKPIPPAWIKRAAALPAHLVTVSEAGIALTREGFLLSNSLIGHILWGNV